MTGHHCRAVQLATSSYFVVDISLQKRSLGQDWGGGSLDDRFIATRWELGISVVSNQAKKKVNSVW